MTVTLVIEIDEVQRLIEIITKIEDPDHRAKGILTSLKTVKREAAIEAHRTFENMMNET
tara:strand:+ start:292 stop:468 length:177 start_codon:yes stop_codon:yes gene_type:complete